jgi:hypothetical protein
MTILLSIAFVVLGLLLAGALLLCFIAWGFDIQYRMQKRTRARRDYIRENADLVDRFLDKIRGEKW